ncbi:MAG: hypothetical protein NVSMB31_06990 [Vulcanimicrobiaceae bacterium]
MRIILVAIIAFAALSVPTPAGPQRPAGYDVGWCGANTCLTYYEGSGFGYRAAARILGFAERGPNGRNVHIRVSVTAPQRPARETIMSFNGWGSPLSFVYSKDDGYKPVVLFKTPYDETPIIRITVADNGIRSLSYINAYLHLVGRRLVEIPEYQVRDDGVPDRSHVLLGPLRFKQVVKIDTREQGAEHSGGGNMWHEAMYRVTAAHQEQIVVGSVGTGEGGIDAATTPNPRPTPVVDKGFGYRTFCLHSADNPADPHGAYYTAC